MYAIFKKSVTLTFKDSVGIRNSDPSPIIIYNKQKGTATAPTIRDYDGWTKAYWTTETTADGTKTVEENGTITNITGNTNYYAIYKKQIELTFNLNGGTGTSPTTITGYVHTNSNNLNVIKNAKISLPTTEATKDGYIFNGWNTKADGTGYHYDNNSQGDFGEDTVLFAEWNASGYKIKFDKNSESATGTMSDLSMVYGTAKNLTENAYTRIGHTFDSWNTQANGSGTRYTDKQSVNNLVTSGEITLYAQWTANTYTIAFNKNNSNASGTMSNMSMTYESAQNLTTNAFAVTTAGITSKQIFTGWNRNADGTGTSYSDGASVSKLTEINGGTVTLYAQWKDASYEVKKSSSAYTYTEDLSNAISNVMSSGTIKLLNNKTDDSSVSCSKTLSFYLNSKTLTRPYNKSINITAGTFTIEDTGTVKQTYPSTQLTAEAVFKLTGGKIVVNNDATFNAYGSIIATNSTSASVDINEGHFNSEYNPTIYLNGHNSVTISNATIYNPNINKAAIHSTTNDTGNITINGEENNATYIGNSGSNSIIDNGATLNGQAAIHHGGTGTLTVTGWTRVYTGEYSESACIGLAKTGSTTLVYGNTKLFSAANVPCIRSLVGGVTIKFNMAKNPNNTDGTANGGLYTYATQVLHVDKGNNATLSWTRGTFVAASANMFYNNSAYITDRVGTKNTNTFTIKYMTAYNNVSGSVSLSPYYVYYLKNTN